MGPMQPIKKKDKDKSHMKRIVEQISWAIFQGGGLWSTTFVSIYQNARFGL